MQDLMESKLLIKKKDIQSVSFVIESQELFSAVGYKVLKNQKQTGLVDCIKVLYNGKIKLLYDTASLHTLRLQLSKLEYKEFMELFCNLLEVIINLENNGFIQIDNLYIDIEYIYIDDDNKIHLIYLPIDKTEISGISMLHQLKDLFLHCMNSNDRIKDKVTVKLTKSLEQDVKGLDSFLNIIKRESKEMIQVAKDERKGGYLHQAFKKGGAANLFGLGSNKFKRNMALVQCETTDPFELIITKPEFTIGKKVELVDGVISSNATISRIHCKIIFKEGNYYISDMGSANGTFINGTRIKEFTELQISENDQIELSNYKFKFAKIH